MPTQSSNLVVASGDAIEYAVPDQTLIIDEVIVGSSSSGNGVYSNESGSTLDNYGTVFAAGGDGAVFLQDNTTVVNAVGAEITGDDGILVSAGGTQSITNRGSIIGTAANALNFYNAQPTMKIVNSGYMYGATGGVAFQAGSGASIHNSGTIESGEEGIYALVDADARTVIVNQAGGLIKGADHAILNEQGILSLTNYGKLEGGIYDAAGTKDTIVNNGAIVGSVMLSVGGDAFEGQNSTSAVNVSGEAGNDHLVGGAFADKLDGGFGNDTLTGGGGKDQFIFDSTTPPNADNCDKITDFTSGTDKIVLSEGAFGDLGPTGHPMQAKYFHAGAVAQTSDQHILYTQSDGHLYYDDDATGPDQPSLFAVLTTEPTIHPGDFLIEA